jgi:hypothetical protein
MKTKCIGIWMDHASAHLMELTSGDMETTTIESTFTFEVKKDTLQKGEKAMHHKEQQEELTYYNKISAAIKNYQEVLVFGPSEAKIELLNVLKADHHFDKTKIETRQVDKMTENQQYAYVKEYFFKHLSAIV